MTCTGSIAELLCCRCQLAARARRRVAVGRPRILVDPVAHRKLLERFLAAATDGDLEGLVALLSADVFLVTDGGGKARAFRHPIRGRTRVARLICKVCPAWAHGEVEVVAVNGAPGGVQAADGLTLGAEDLPGLLVDAQAAERQAGSGGKQASS